MTDSEKLAVIRQFINDKSRVDFREGEKEQWRPTFCVNIEELLTGLDSPQYTYRVRPDDPPARANKTVWCKVFKPRHESSPVGQWYVSYMGELFRITECPSLVKFSHFVMQGGSFSSSPIGPDGVADYVVFKE